MGHLDAKFPRVAPGFHSRDGRHFLGVRQGRSGRVEIVYDGRHGRFVWRLADGAKGVDLDRFLSRAINASGVLSALFDGLKQEEIEFEIEQEAAPGLT